ncbi:MAG: IS66 family transposase [Anaerolineae bacterium]|nr:IS66 family transposase [Anaerolineae bacterium]
MKQADEPLRIEQLQGLDKADLLVLVVAMQAQLKEMAAEIQRLKDQLAKDSHNSGKPPSSDGLKKRRTTSLRERGKRANGGQVGHKGQTLKLAEIADRVMRHEVEQCSHCGINLNTVTALRIEKRQVVEVPRVRLEVTEHQAVIKCCPNCGKQVKAQFPEGVSQAVQYGTGLQAQMVYLNNYQLLPLQRTCEILGEVYGQRPSQAAVIAANERVATAVEASVEHIQQHLKSSALIHCDETGTRVQGQLKWLHVVSTPSLTLYGVHNKRSQVAMRTMDILPDFQGWVVHDAFVSYWQFETCQHALCNAHHLRELRFLSEHYQQDWAEQLAQLLLKMKHFQDTAHPLSEHERQRYEQDYDRLLEHGLTANPALPATGKRGRPKHTPAQNLLARFRTYKDAILAFWRDPTIPFDNNQAERDLRMMKLQQKISGCFRTRSGADCFCLIRSYLSTARKQGLNILDALSAALHAAPFLPT